jgi:hypothetical protein
MESSEATPFHPQPRVAPSASNLRVVTKVADVEALFEDTVNAVILVRAGDASIVDEARAYVAAFAASPPRTLLAALAGADGAARLSGAALDGYPRVLGRVLEACEIVAELTGARELGVRVVVAGAPLCPALHVDRVTVRAVLALCGAGTEVAAGAAVGRSERSLVAAPAGSIAFLKGEAWPGNRGRGAEHRSPPSSPEPRLLVTIDPLA